MYFNATTEQGMYTDFKQWDLIQILISQKPSESLNVELIHYTLG